MVARVLEGDVLRPTVEELAVGVAAQSRVDMRHPERKQLLSGRRALFSGRHIKVTPRNNMSHPNLVVARLEVCLAGRPVSHRALRKSKSLALESKSSLMDRVLLYVPLLLRPEGEPILLGNL